jgi:hypothetical protein
MRLCCRESWSKRVARKGSAARGAKQAEGTLLTRGIRTEDEAGGELRQQRKRGIDTKEGRRGCEGLGSHRQEENVRVVKSKRKKGEGQQSIRVPSGGLLSGGTRIIRRPQKR